MIRKAIIVLLALAATGTTYLWADSYRERAALNGSTFHGWCLDRTLGSDTGLHMTVARGGIWLSYRRAVEPDAVDGERGFLLTSRFGYLRYPYRDYKPCILNAGHHYVGPSSDRLVVHSVGLPLWLLTIAFAAYPAIAFYRGPLRRYRRRRHGLCPRCGYDLTGNESGICSECGTVPCDAAAEQPTA